MLGFLIHVSDGPLWNSINDFHIDLCHDWWWTTLLYVANIVNPGKYCIWHSWYLNVDMQLYFISPIILYPIWRFRKRTALVIPAIFTISSFSVVFIFVVYMMKHFRVAHTFADSGTRDVMIYTTTYARIDSWMIGILIGYIMHKTEGKRVELSKPIIFIGWTMTALVMLTAIFGAYPLHQDYFLENPLIADAIYESLKGFSWCMAMAWVIFACHYSRGGIVKRFLSLSIWMPISKLSFCIYLIHVPVQLVYTASLKIPGYFSHYRTIFLFFGNFGVSFFIAFAWALMFEYPILTISSVLVSKFRVKNKVKIEA